MGSIPTLLCWLVGNQSIDNRLGLGLSGGFDIDLCSEGRLAVVD